VLAQIHSHSDTSRQVVSDRRLQADRQGRIAKFGQEWADADDEERARRQSDLLEQLQWPRRLAPLDGGAGQSHAPSGGGLMSAPVVKEEKLSPEAASLIAVMLHPEPSARIKAPQTVADSYFRDFELQDDEEIPEQKLDQPWRPLAGGRGAFGVVYRSRHRGTDVAVKRIIANQGGNVRLFLSGGPAQGTIEEDFLREVHMLRRLKHPHIVLYMGYCKSAQGLCIVTELCHTSVEAFLHGDQSKNYSTTRALSIAREAALGMTYLHGENPPVVHRDLKPGNILLDRNLRAKVCDFGLARQDGVVRDQAGTPHYLAPEILVDAVAADTPSDVYSFGVVLFELFMRERPFAELNLNPQLAHLQMSDHYREGGSLSFERFPSAFPSAAQRVSEVLQQRIEGCLQRSPEQRPAFTKLAPQLGELMMAFKKLAAKKRPVGTPAQPEPQPAAAADPV